MNKLVLQWTLFSSLPSPQLLSPSHSNRADIHFPFWQANVFIGQIPEIINKSIPNISKKFKNETLVMLEFNTFFGNDLYKYELHHCHRHNPICHCKSCSTEYIDHLRI